MLMNKNTLLKDSVTFIQKKVKFWSGCLSWQGTIISNSSYILQKIHALKATIIP